MTSSPIVSRKLRAGFVSTRTYKGEHHVRAGQPAHRFPVAAPTTVAERRRIAHRTVVLQRMARASVWPAVVLLLVLGAQASAAPTVAGSLTTAVAQETTR